MRDQLHTQNFTGEFFHFFNRARQLDTAALAATTGVDLRLHDPHRAAEFLSGFYRLLNGECCNATRHRHTKLTQDVLALVLVNLHELFLSGMDGGMACAAAELRQRPRAMQTLDCIMVHRDIAAPVRHDGPINPSQIHYAKNLYRW
ncbi:hypothetical protein GALL_479710 [mine drainage metagenome]|uniref:Uncharacterized protein n=1 Tax=mine drainage metagenome TaxID=410659 RepID=A0A1J5PFL6_9ZZZZ